MPDYWLVDASETQVVIGFARRDPRESVRRKVKHLHRDVDLRSMMTTEYAKGRHAFGRDGFRIARGFVPAAGLRELRGALGDVSEAGMRGLLDRDGPVAAFARSPRVVATMAALVGPHARAVRAFVLDKSADNNWSVGWHQDATVAVRERVSVAGFAAWSRKDGVVHVRPPAVILERMASLRLHLDDALADAGPLLVAAGTHVYGVIPERDVPGFVERSTVVTCTCSAGDAILARPLLLHASRRSQAIAKRRILHVEYAGADLPEPLEWRPF